MWFVQNPKRERSLRQCRSGRFRQAQGRSQLGRPRIGGAIECVEAVFRLLGTMRRGLCPERQACIVNAKRWSKHYETSRNYLLQSGTEIRSTSALCTPALPMVFSWQSTTTAEYVRERLVVCSVAHRSCRICLGTSQPGQVDTAHSKGMNGNFREEPEPISAPS